jgi:Protein of unknown function DUF47
VAAVKRNWFLPQNPDVLDMLCRQAAITCEGLAALCAWANAEPDAAKQVRELEHRADDTKRELRLALTSAFITPIDAEDLYVMSERLDAVLNGAKDTVRESEVMGIAPDQAVAAMAALLAVDDLREVMGRRELYRRFSRVSETLVEAADRVWYATVKEE